MPTSPGPMLAALDALWQRLRADVSELPPIRPTVSPTKSKLDHGPQRWTRDDDGIVSGLVVTVDVLREGPEAVVEHVLHEAAHILNWTRGRPDVTMRGVYHNQTFLTAAEEVGLVWPEDARRVPGKGFNSPVLGDVARSRHATDIAAMGEVLPAILPHMELPASTWAKTRTDRLTWMCKCDPPRSFRIGRTVAAQGPILCGVCGKPFAEE
ncbi:hypothetical protein ACGFZB_28630 [Streptomyces cinerochromogenes]|uniref:SprT-like domain-containing protein n=1 Tax=Streptomyces cinerochromogenes TaxID=66422 RepID=A0ABW7BF38_9ACTN